MCEKAVSIILLSVYMFVLMRAINLILFSELARLVYDAAFALVSVLLVCCIDALAERFYKKRYRQPRLLIIDTDPTNISRTKRIKYGVLKKYDSWYENIEGKTSEEFVEFVNDQFPLFDAICVLNGFHRFEYRVAVNTAVKMNKDLFIVPEMVDVGKSNGKIVCLDDILTLYMPKTEFSAAELFFKRTVDIVLSLAGLIAAAIPMAIIAAAIKLTSPGPVIYKQTRYTRGKREFEIYKFRTMIPDAEKLSGPKFAEKTIRG